MSKKQWHKHRAQVGKSFKLSDYNTNAPGKEPDKEELEERLNGDKEEIANLQNQLYAENRQSMLIILQGMDSAGKDSFIKHIMSDMNPQGLAVHSFKHPSGIEQEHDYLWRHYVYLPAQGQIAIFNRSHYENVLISRVHPEIVLAERMPGIDKVGQIDKHFWQQRYRQINDFENVLVETGTQIIKFFLHLSKDEQRRRFLSRIDEKRKHWKFASADIQERAFWDEYQKAYEQAIRHTSTKQAPWYILPADDKWYAQLVGGAIILDKLREMDPKFPQLSKEEYKMMDSAKAQLEKE